MTQCAVTCQNVRKQCSFTCNHQRNSCTTLYYSRDTFAYNRTPVLDMTIKVLTPLPQCLKLPVYFTCFSPYPS